MKAILFLTFFSFYSFACQNLYLSSKSISKKQVKEIEQSIKQSKASIRNIKQIKSLDDLTSSELNYLRDSFSNYLSRLNKKEALKASINILSNKQYGIIIQSKKKLINNQALLVFENLKPNKKEKVTQVINDTSLSKSKKTKKLLKYMNKKNVKTIINSLFTKKNCCLKKCKKCPVNFYNFKREQLAKKENQS